MAITGLKHPVAAKVTDESYSSIQYGQGVVVGAAIRADVTIETPSDNDLYGNNGIIETDSSFSGGSITLGIDDLSDDVYCYLMGAQRTNMLGKDVIRDSGADTPPYVGFGYYKTGKKNNVPYYEVNWYYKLQFGKPSEATETKGQQITWQTPTIEGPVMTLENGDWRDRARFDREEDAVAWLDSMARLGASVDRSNLQTAITAAKAEEANAETYTSVSWAALVVALNEAERVAAAPYATQDMIDEAEHALTQATTGLVTG